jgi:hypothetical protein
MSFGKARPWIFFISYPRQIIVDVGEEAQPAMDLMVVMALGPELQLVLPR